MPAFRPVTTKRSEAVSIDGDGMAMTVWVPDAGHGPGILLIQEIFGVGPYIVAVAERLADAGYVVGAPDVFWRFAPNWVTGHDEEGLAASMGQVGNLNFDQAIQDCVVAIDHLAGLPEVDASQRPGVLGFCLGGTLGFAVAIADSPSVCVSYYGSGVPSMIAAIDEVQCPTLFHFGVPTPTSRSKGWRRWRKRSASAATSCSTSRRLGTPSTTTKRRCSTTRPRHEQRGPRRWRTSRSTCR